MFKIQPPMRMQIAFEDHPESDPKSIDLLKAYDQASKMQQESEDWLENWGQWIGQEIGHGPLEYSQARGLWEEVSRVADGFLDDRKKKAETIVYLLCFTEVRQVSTEPSPN